MPFVKEWKHNSIDEDIRDLRIALVQDIHLNPEYLFDTTIKNIYQQYLESKAKTAELLTELYSLL